MVIYVVKGMRSGNWGCYTMRSGAGLRPERSLNASVARKKSKKI